MFILVPSGAIQCHLVPSTFLQLLSERNDKLCSDTLNQISDIGIREEGGDVEISAIQGHLVPFSAMIISLAVTHLIKSVTLVSDRKVRMLVLGPYSAIQSHKALFSNIQGHPVPLRTN